MKWAFRRLDDVCSVIMGQAPPGDAYNNDSIGWPLIAGAGDFVNGRPAPKKHTREATKTSAAGDIILGIRASIGEKVLSDGEYCLGRGVAGLRPSTDLDGRFLWHWLTVVAPNLAAKGRGATFKQVNRNDIGELSIPLPSLKDQRRIVKVLDRADEMRVKRREALADLDELTRSIFLDMFGSATHNPFAWPIAHIGALADVQGGLQLSASRSKHPIEVQYLRVANVHRGRLHLAEIKTLKASPAEISRTSLKDQDLLIVEGHGNSEEIGRAALWDDSVTPCVHQNHLIRARFDPARIVPIFACHYVNSPGGRRHLLRAAKTTSGLNTISVSDVRSTPLATPPLDLQHAFAHRVAKVEDLKAAHQRSLTELDALFASLQDRAFRGLL
ncbi:restriction endonuclease subunit S [Micromonospora okii]|uniref:restriction endonuclease subunit S n=1 Tax=Micromonospora okii TaxID=1182970 RepID=UPI0021079C39|nr:restriction endonuclease subunit S [Micromonospora okii]